MEYEFDKEINSLLRQARPETVVSERLSAHADADEISLFAENALTQKARMRVTEHLADCAKCRKILSNIIALNAEDASENLHTEEAAPLITEATIPWYRKLFAFPQLAYTMGGLTVLLAGMIGYVTLQSYNESKSASIAQTQKSIERPRGGSGVSSDGDTVTVESYSNAAASNASNAAMTTNSSSNTVAASKPASPTSSANANAAASSTLTKDQPAVAQAEPAPAVRADNLAEQERKNEDKTSNADTTYSVDGADRAGAKPNYQPNSVARNQVVTPDSRNAESRQIQNLPVQGRRTQDLQMITRAPERAAAAPPQENDDAPKAKSAKKEASEKNKSVGGKNFVYKNSVWYDESYKQQKTTNVRRNSDDYKKLDSGLRSIADNLGGTVVIVWNGKAYRIQ